MIRILLDGRSLRLEDLASISSGEAEVSIRPSARARMFRSRALVEKLARGAEPIYGVTTGFGRLANVRVGPDEARELQLNLLRSHAAGVGAPLPPDEVRLVLALRAQVLAAGHSGVRPEVAEGLLALLRKGVLPVVPEQGSVGASGDLAPLAHLALVLVGEGEATFRGRRLGGAEALRAAGLRPLRLEAKEGLSLVNGTQVTTAILARAALGARNLLRTADLVAAMSLEALKGSIRPFEERIARLRPHPGHAVVSENVRRLMRGSEILRSHENCGKVQDAYSLRCVPQVHGAIRDALAHVEETITREINSVTDNPLVFLGEGEVLSGGNFHAIAPAMASDFLSLALTVLGTMSERRTESLVNPDSSGLPAFLTKDGGLQSGFMMAQVTAAALASENKALAHPASADSIPTGAGREDHVSMGPHAARKARAALANAERVVAIEALCAAQGLEFHRQLRPGRGVEAAWKVLRRAVPRLEQDRPLAPDIESAARLVREGALLAAAEDAAGPVG
ncbi:MAG: histidine ammonia-lyase [Planctomycetales bacterium]|nr:histidine ammonia-lyase [Planctomycetales bacterium]